MLPNEDIIPISYMSGTGGNFLCHFIVSAKENNKERVLLSHFGNAHGHGLKDINANIGTSSATDISTINNILSTIVDPLVKKPYFAPAHLFDINTINKYFKKSIRIIYDTDDIEEIAIIFYGKWIRQSKEFKTTEIPQLITLIHDNAKFFKKEKDMYNVLFVSWKELFKGNIDELIQKLSTFTHINSDNFNTESLIHWRTKTQYCIDTFTKNE